MRRSILPTCLVLLAACGSPKSTAGSSSATSAESAPPSDAVASASASTAAEPPPPPLPVASTYVPSTCSMRVFLDGAALFAGTTDSKLEGLEEALVSVATAKAPKAKERTKALAAHGATLGAIRTAAACKSDAKKLVTAVAFDRAKLDAPLSTIVAEAFGEPKKPLTPKVDGAAALFDAGTVRIAALDAEGVLVIANSDDDRRTALKGAGADGFTTVNGARIWFFMPAGEAEPESSGRLTVEGDTANVDILFALPKRAAAQYKANPKAFVDRFESAIKRAKTEFSVGRFAKFKPMIPIFENSKITAEGERIHAVSSFPANIVAPSLEAVSLDPRRLFGR